MNDLERDRDTSFDELKEHIARLSQGEKLRLREWLDQQLAGAEEEIRGREWSVEAEVREIREDTAERDYLPDLD